jgi:cold-inducible RNA-binding protein
MSRIFIGNIPHTSTDLQLQQWVESFGFIVDSAIVIRDRSTGQSRGFGFVTLKTDHPVNTAIAGLNGQRMLGRILTVNQALPLPEPSRRHSGPTAG